MLLKASGVSAERFTRLLQFLNGEENDLANEDFGAGPEDIGGVKVYTRRSSSEMVLESNTTINSKRKPIRVVFLQESECKDGGRSFNVTLQIADTFWHRAYSGEEKMRRIPPRFLLKVDEILNS